MPVKLQQPTVFPAGTSVGAYKESLRNTDRAPAGSASETKTVASDGSLTFTTLPSAGLWVAYAQVSGQHRYVEFGTPAIDTGARVLDESPPNVQWPEFGALGNDTGDDSTALNAAFAAGPCRIPAGTYKCLSGLVTPRDQPNHILGDGPNNTVLHFPNDLGAGVYAIGGSGSDSGVRHRLEDFRIQGPNPGAGVGVLPSSMKGVLVGGKYRLTRVACNGTGAGADVQGDHTILRDCDLGGYYGILFGTPAGGGDLPRGNSLVEGCDLAGAQYASLAVTTGNAIEGGTFLQTHFGFAPYGVAIVDDATDRRYPTPLNSCSFYDCAFEQIGNGVIFSNAAAGYGKALGNRFFGCGTSGRSVTYAIAASTAYAVDVEDFTDTTIDGSSAINGSGAFLATPFDTGTIRAGAVNNMDWRGAAGALDGANSSGKPLFETDTANGSLRGGGVVCALFRNSGAGALAVGDLVQADNFVIGAARAQKYVGGGGGIPVGVAYNARAAGKIVPIAIAGQALVNADTGTGGGGLTYLKPSATSGKVQAAAVTDQPRVGITESPEASGQLRARLSLPASWPT